MADENKIIDEKFADIERKLRNSFKAIKEDINLIKSGVESPPQSKDNRLRKDFDLFKDDISKNLSDISRQVTSIASKKPSSDNAKFNQLLQEITQLRADIATKQDISKLKTEFNNKITGVKEDVLRSPEILDLLNTKADYVKKKNLSLLESSMNERFSQLESNISSELDSIKKSTKKSDIKDSLMSEIALRFQDGFKDFTSGLKAIEDNVKESFRIQKSYDDESKEELREEVRKTVSYVKRDLQKTNSIVLEKLREKENEIIGLQKQINFLRSKINSFMTPSKQELKETKKLEISTPSQSGEVIKSIIKALIIIIPIVIILYAFATTFLVTRNYNYFYDIGGEEDKEKPYLYPANSVSDIEYMNASVASIGPTMDLLGTKEGVKAVANYRDIKAERVYFDIPSVRTATHATINMQFRNNFPRGGIMSIGIKNKVGWNYTYFEVFNQDLYSYSVDKEWIVGTAEIDLASLGLSGVDLAAVIDTPHLKDPFLSDMYIGIDYINITFSKSSKSNTSATNSS